MQKYMVKSREYHNSIYEKIADDYAAKFKDMKAPKEGTPAASIWQYVNGRGMYSELTDKQYYALACGLWEANQ